jgi:hypothetical protein
MGGEEAVRGDVVARLSGRYGVGELDRLVADLEPLLQLTEPAAITVDLRRLEFLFPSTTVALAATLADCRDRQLNQPGSTILLPDSEGVRTYLSRIDLIQTALDRGHA